LNKNQLLRESKAKIKKLKADILTKQQVNGQVKERLPNAKTKHKMGISNPNK
jgi:hypothetical protein